MSEETALERLKEKMLEGLEEKVKELESRLHNAEIHIAELRTREKARTATANQAPSFADIAVIIKLSLAIAGIWLIATGVIKAADLVEILK